MKATQRSREMLYSPEALVRLRNGFEKLATPLASTLGPSRRLVINAIAPSEIELLADTGTIATRFIELKTRGENVGAMMLRTMVMQMHERYGDGAATATVLAREMLRGGNRLLAAGINPSIMRQGIERGVAVAKQELKKQAQPVEGQETFTHLATSMTGDQELGKILGEMIDMLGENASIVVNEHDAPRVEREYVNGGRWTAIPGDRLLIPEGKAGLELHHPLIMIVNEELTTLDQVQPALELAASLPDKHPLLIICRDLKEAARDALVVNHIRGVLTIGTAILKSAITFMYEDMGDIAILTGGEVLSEETGRSPKQIKPQFFGRARRATITHATLTIVDGDGNQATIRKRTAEIRGQMNHAKEKDRDWDRQRTRIGRLTGGIGIIKVGAPTEHEREIKKELLTKALRAMDSIQAAGVVPGGGVAYLNCIPALEAASRACTNSDEAAGIALVATALTAPFNQIVHNYGAIYPPLALAEVQRLGPGYGFDGQQGDYALMAERGILDSAQIAEAALDAAGSLAAMAITTDTIIMM